MACVLPGLAFTAVGAAGAVGAGTGVTGKDAADGTPVPMLFVQ